MNHSKSLIKEFDKVYFDNYSLDTPSKSYNQTWMEYSFLPLALQVTESQFSEIKSILILGSATGQPLSYVKMKGYVPSGIEISSWAAKQTPHDLMSSLHIGDVSTVLPKLIERGHTWDLVFSNCLQFLTEEKISTLLIDIQSCSKYFCHYGGYQGFGFDELDLKLKTLKPFSWWNQKMLNSGFFNTEEPYFWSSFRNSTS